MAVELLEAQISPHFPTHFTTLFRFRDSHGGTGWGSDHNRSWLL